MNLKMMMLGGAVASCLAASAAIPSVAVKTAKPVLVSEDDPYTLVGRVAGSATVRVSARVVGNLWESKGHEGDIVKKGDVLYRIEDTVYKANLQTAKAKEAELVAELALAEVEVQRYNASVTSGGVSQSERDKTILKRDIVKAELEAAKAQVVLAQNDLDYCTITSPVDGRLGCGKVDAGNNVGPDSGTLRDIIAFDPIDINVSIPEPRVIWAMEQNRIKRNIRVRLVRADGKEYPIDLRIEAADNKVDTATGTLRVRFRGANPDGNLIPGGYVKILLSEIFETPKLTVPMSAVVFDGAKRYLYIVRDGKAGRREVALGNLVGDRAFVEKGLSADDAVVVEGVHKLVDGAAVKEM